MVVGKVSDLHSFLNLRTTALSEVGHFTRVCLITSEIIPRWKQVRCDHRLSSVRQNASLTLCSLGISK